MRRIKFVDVQTRIMMINVTYTLNASLASCKIECMIMYASKAWFVPWLSRIQLGSANVSNHTSIQTCMHTIYEYIHTLHKLEVLWIQSSTNHISNQKSREVWCNKNLKTELFPCIHSMQVSACAKDSDCSKQFCRALQFGSAWLKRPTSCRIIVSGNGIPRRNQNFPNSKNGTYHCSSVCSSSKESQVSHCFTGSLLFPQFGLARCDPHGAPAGSLRLMVPVPTTMAGV